ncbi:hypothetical protein LUZ60_014167 [Juncus effusus]|nr:hypothetical protein LUZ60_014167 [Juncus effusus]
MAISLILLSIILTSFSHATVSQSQDTLKTYIVHLSPPSSTFKSSTERLNWYKKFLPSTDSTGSRFVYTYSEIINGFAVRLSENELKEMEKKEGFLHAYPDKLLEVKTTRTPKFLGLSREGPGFWTKSNYGKGVIIGMIDTGISPTHPSFKDTGMPPPPSKWKGKCEFNLTDCNNKLIGARTFLYGHDVMQGSNSSVSQGPYDYTGHGTHTSSTAAGTFVEGANINGLANGTASGIAPLAYLAMYKVCQDDYSCADSDILAGFDGAVHDGVDVISVSLGGFFSQVFYEDSIAIGAFSAVEKGIFVSCAAGNGGPSNYSIQNGAPWQLSVGASGIDRSLRSVVNVKNYKSDFYGQSGYQPNNFTAVTVPLVYPGTVGGYEAAYCEPGSLDGIDVRGKIVICDVGGAITQSDVVKAAGGLGIVLANDVFDGDTTIVYPLDIPGSFVSFSDGTILKGLAVFTKSNASIVFKGTILETPLAPVLASFSSRGPNFVDPNILKPDIIGPGLNILAAWPFLIGPTSPGSYFNMDSGTSMSTPHLSGIAALLKSAHPNWSPAMIKSAIMTTAYLNGNDGKPIADELLRPANIFSIGSGHVDPSKANNPGLVYDIKTNNYLNYLCGLNYSDAQVSTVLHRKVTCSGIRKISGLDLNLPSFVVQLNTNNSYIAYTKRAVINVGAPNSKYTVKITMDDQVEVKVKPDALSFTRVNETAEYTVVFKSSNLAVAKVYQGYLTWISSDGCITVRSPLVIVVGITLTY